MLRPLPALSLGLIIILSALLYTAISTGLDRPSFLASLGDSAVKYGLYGIAATLLQTSANSTADTAASLDGNPRKERLNLAAERGLRAARVLYDQGSLAAAQRVERRLLRLAPWRSDVRYFQQELQIARGQDEQARQDLFEAVLDTDEAQAAYLIGLSFLKTGQGKDGAQYLAHAINRDATHFGANYELGRYYVRVGQRNQARERGLAALRSAQTLDENLASYELLDQAGAGGFWLTQARLTDILAAYGATLLALLIYLALLPLPWTARKLVHLLHIPTGRFARRKAPAHAESPVQGEPAARRA